MYCFQHNKWKDEKWKLKNIVGNHTFVYHPPPTTDPVYLHIYINNFSFVHNIVCVFVTRILQTQVL